VSSCRDLRVDDAHARLHSVLNNSRLKRPPLAAGLPDESLEEINRLWTIARAFANTAHDVNNALQVIAGNAELLSTKELEPAVQRRIEAISAETARATSLIGALQSYVRAERDPSPVVDLWTVADRAVGMRAAALRRLRMTLKVEGDRFPAPVAGPGSRLLQVALDLLLEAERVLRGSPMATIRVSVEARGQSFALRVTAAASEITEAYPTVEPGAEGALTADAQLWIAGYLAERAGGSVSAASADGHCEWTVTVPAVVPAKV
jgi:signal transduction histidine kinase